MHLIFKAPLSQTIKLRVEFDVGRISIQLLKFIL